MVKSETKLVSALGSPAALVKLSASRLGEADYSLVGFAVTPNLDNPRRDDVILSGLGQTLPERSYYSKPEVMKDFEAYLAVFFRSVGADRNGGRAHA